MLDAQSMNTTIYINENAGNLRTVSANVPNWRNAGLSKSLMLEECYAIARELPYNIYYKHAYKHALISLQMCEDCLLSQV